MGRQLRWLSSYCHLPSEELHLYGTVGLYWEAVLSLTQLRGSSCPGSPSLRPHNIVQLLDEEETNIDVKTSDSLLDLICGLPLHHNRTYGR